MSYREVIPDQTDPSDWKEIALNTGKCFKGYVINSIIHESTHYF